MMFFMKLVKGLHPFKENRPYKHGCFQLREMCYLNIIAHGNIEKTQRNNYKKNISQSLGHLSNSWLFTMKQISFFVKLILLMTSKKKLLFYAFMESCPLKKLANSLEKVKTIRVLPFIE